MGIFAPNREYFLVSLRNSTISSTSSLASSMPATSSKVIGSLRSLSSLALDFPNPIAPPRPPPCILFIRKNHTPIKIRNGRSGPTKAMNPLGSWDFASIWTPLSISSSVTSTSLGLMVVNSELSVVENTTFSPSRTARDTSPALTLATKLE